MYIEWAVLETVCIVNQCDCTVLYGMYGCNELEFIPYLERRELRVETKFLHYQYAHIYATQGMNHLPAALQLQPTCQMQK